MSNCPQCQALANQDANFCISCGHQLRAIQSTKVENRAAPLTHKPPIVKTRVSKQTSFRDYPQMSPAPDSHQASEDQHLIGILLFCFSNLVWIIGAITACLKCYSFYLGAPPRNNDFHLLLWSSVAFFGGLGATLALRAFSQKGSATTGERRTVFWQIVTALAGGFSGVLVSLWMLLGVLAIIFLIIICLIILMVVVCIGGGALS